MRRLGAMLAGGGGDADDKGGRGQALPAPPPPAGSLSPLHALAWQLEAELTREVPLGPLPPAAAAARQTAAAAAAPSPALRVPRILHRRVNALSSFMAPRDAVTLQDVGVCRAGGADAPSSLVVYEVSVQHRFVPPAPQGYVRMAVFLEAYVLEPCRGGGTRVSFVSQISLRGQLPPWLARTLIDSQTLAPLSALRKALFSYSAATAAVRGRAGALPPPAKGLFSLSAGAASPRGHAQRDAAGPFSAPANANQLLQLRRAQLLRAQRQRHDRASYGSSSELFERPSEEATAPLSPPDSGRPPGLASPSATAAWAEADAEVSDALSSSEDEDGFVVPASGASGVGGAYSVAFFGESVSQRGSFCAPDGGSARPRAQRRRQPSSVRFRLSVGGASAAAAALSPAPTSSPVASLMAGKEEEDWWREAVAELTAYADGASAPAAAGAESQGEEDAVRGSSNSAVAPVPPSGEATAASPAALLPVAIPCACLSGSHGQAASLAQPEAEHSPGVRCSGHHAHAITFASDAAASAAPAAEPAPPSKSPPEPPHLQQAPPPQPPQQQQQQAVSLADFELMCVLGRGGYGKVLLVRRVAPRQLAPGRAPPRDVGALYAMKVLRKRGVIQRRSAGRAMTERRILSRVRHHPFIVSLRYAFQVRRRPQGGGRRRLL